MRPVLVSINSCWRPNDVYCPTTRRKSQRTYNNYSFIAGLMVLSLLAFCYLQSVDGQSAAPTAKLNSSSSDSSSGSSGQQWSVGLIVGTSIFGFVWCCGFCAFWYVSTAGCTRLPACQGGGGGGGSGDGGGGDGDGGGGGKILPCVVIFLHSLYVNNLFEHLPTHYTNR